MALVDQLGIGKPVSKFEMHDLFDMALTVRFI